MAFVILAFGAGLPLFRGGSFDACSLVAAFTAAALLSLFLELSGEANLSIADRVRALTA